MENQILSSEISAEEMAAFEAKAAELAVKYKCSKVHVYVGLEPETNERIIAYFKEPSYLQKILAMDKIATVGVFMAGDELRSALVLTEESDPRTYGNTSNCDIYKLGLTSACVPIIEMAANQFKKK